VWFFQLRVLVWQLLRLDKVAAGCLAAAQLAAAEAAAQSAGGGGGGATAAAAADAAGGSTRCTGDTCKLQLPPAVSKAPKPSKSKAGAADPLMAIELGRMCVA
jgi:hypothetical protein